jgi:hypothetical protein
MGDGSLVDGIVNRGTTAGPSSSLVELAAAGHHSDKCAAKYACFSNEDLKKH